MYRGNPIHNVVIDVVKRFPILFVRGHQPTLRTGCEALRAGQWIINLGSEELGRIMSKFGPGEILRALAAHHEIALPYRRRRRAI